MQASRKEKKEKVIAHACPAKNRIIRRSVVVPTRKRGDTRQMRTVVADHGTAGVDGVVLRIKNAKKQYINQQPREKQERDDGPIIFKKTFRMKRLELSQTMPQPRPYFVFIQRSQQRALTDQQKARDEHGHDGYSGQKRAAIHIPLPAAQERRNKIEQRGGGQNTQKKRRGPVEKSFG